MEITATIQSKFYTLSKTTSLRGWCKLAYNKSKIVDGLHFDISKNQRRRYEFGTMVHIDPLSRMGS